MVALAGRPAYRSGGVSIAEGVGGIPVQGVGEARDGYVLPMPERVTIADRVGPTSPSAWRWRLRGVLPGVVSAVVVSVGVSALALLVQARLGPLATFDQSVIRAATDVTRAHPGLFSALLVWQAAFQPLNVYIVATLVCGLAWWRGGLRSRAIRAFVTMMVAWNLALDLKLLVARARPVVADPVSSAPGYRFPSGHVANATAAGAVLVILLWPVLSPRGPGDGLLARISEARWGRPRSDAATQLNDRVDGGPAGVRVGQARSMGRPAVMSAASWCKVAAGSRVPRDMSASRTTRWTWPVGCPCCVRARERRTARA